MVGCPVCRAENTTGPPCRRCRADLALLFELEERRDAALAAAEQAAVHGDGKATARLAGHAHWLRHGPDAARLLAIGRLLRRDFSGAWQAYRLRESEGS